MFANKVKPGKKEIKNLKQRRTEQKPTFNKEFSGNSPFEYSGPLFNEITQYLDYKDLAALTEVNKLVNALTIASTHTHKLKSHSGIIGTYHELKQSCLFNNVITEIDQLQKNLAARPKYTKTETICYTPECTYPSWAIFLTVCLLMYFAGEGFLIYKAASKPPYYHESNVIKCAQNIDGIGNTSAKDFARYAKEGCSLPEDFFVAAITVGIVVLLAIIGTTIIIRAANGDENGINFRERELTIGGTEVEISKDEWDALIKKVDALFAKLEKYTSIKENKEVKLVDFADDEKKAHNETRKKFDKNNLPIIQLQNELKKIDALAKNKGTAFINACIFKHQPLKNSLPANANNDCVIDIENNNKKNRYF